MTFAERLTESFSQLRHRLELTLSGYFFKVYAVYMVCQWYVDNDKPRPARDALSGLLTGAAGKTLTWMEIHLSAQLQAALYSVRMLKQILGYVRVVVREGIPPLLGDLDMILEGVEQIEKLIPSRLEVVKEKLSKLEIRGLLDTVFSLLGEGRSEEPEMDADNGEGSSTADSVPSDFTEVPSKKHKKRRIAESKAIPPASKEPPKKPNNIYRLLAES